jgi:hypothetical protein
LATSSPSGSWTATDESLTATTFQPASASRNASWDPALPKPWIAAVGWSTSSSTRSCSSVMTWNAPSEVALLRPGIPPSASGLPVIAAGRWPRSILLYSETIQPITSSLVATSGAGTSRSGPITSLIAAM